MDKNSVLHLHEGLINVEIVRVIHFIYSEFQVKFIYSSPLCQNCTSYIASNGNGSFLSVCNGGYSVGRLRSAECDE
jgi:hypothetical protein